MLKFGSYPGAYSKSGPKQGPELKSYIRVLNNGDHMGPESGASIRELDKGPESGT